VDILTLARDSSGVVELWEVTRDGLALEIASGVEGTQLRTSRKKFASPRSLEEWLRKEIGEKLAEGYKIREQPAAEPQAPAATED
jgi:hypothetical protein